MRLPALATAALTALAAVTACKPPTTPAPPSSACSAIDFANPAPAQTFTPATAAATMVVTGTGAESGRYTAEVAVRGSVAYTTTWGTRAGQPGNKINVWDVSGPVPVLLDSVLVSGSVNTLGDVSIADDGSIMIVPTEFAGSLVVFSLADPAKPVQVARFAPAEVSAGVHTAKLARVNGTLYAFLAVNPAGIVRSRLVIVRLSNPAAPEVVFSHDIPGSAPFIHDTFVRDGLLFVSAWNGGVDVWDLGGCGPEHGASPEQPRHFANARTVGGKTHNVWWLYDPASGSRRFLLIGEEGPGIIGSQSSGDVHVVDLANPAEPREVAFFKVPGAGTHNFSVDEARGILYAAYYSGGVRAIDVRGDLAACDQQHQVTLAGLTRCDLRAAGRELAVGLMENNQRYVWGVQYLDGFLYASDMLTGLWKLEALDR